MYVRLHHFFPFWVFGCVFQVFYMWFYPNPLFSYFNTCFLFECPQLRHSLYCSTYVDGVCFFVLMDRVSSQASSLLSYYIFFLSFNFLNHHCSGHVPWLVEKIVIYPGTDLFFSTVNFKCFLMVSCYIFSLLYFHHVFLVIESTLSSLFSSLEHIYFFYHFSCH